jgi:hypothetical protein
MDSPKYSHSIIENVTYDSTLNQHEHKVLFPKKLALVNAMLAEYGVPAEFEAEQRQRATQKESSTMSKQANKNYSQSASNS